MNMAYPSTDKLLFAYWSVLTPAQKKAMVKYTTSLSAKDNPEAQVLHDPPAEYDHGGLPAEIQLLSENQKSALLMVLEVFAKESADFPGNLLEYNAELDEADAGFSKGEFKSHEQVVKMSEEWLYGNQKD